MASLEISPLNHRFDDDEIAALKVALREYSSEDFDTPPDAGSHPLEGNVDDDLLADFLDQLDANDAPGDLYLPVEFEDSFRVAGIHVGSAHQLLAALENMRDTLDFDEDEPDEADEVDEEVGDELPDDDDDDAAMARFNSDEVGGLELKDEQLSHMWRLFYKGAKAAIRTGLCLFVTRE